MKIPRLPVIATHIIGWVLFQSLPLVFLFSMMGTNAEHIVASFAYWQFCIFYVIVFYLHQYVLLPKLYHARKKLLYVLSLAALLAAAIYLRPFDHMTIRQREIHGDSFREMRLRRLREEGFRLPPGERFEGRRMRLDIIGVFLLMMVIMFSIAIDISRRSRLAEQRAARAEADKANAELSFLKAQINPHFLFNTLNNIYSMAVTRHEHTADMLLKLSNIMRYVTDEVDADYVPLQNELDCISDYIELQRLRLGKKTTVHYTVDGDATGKTIAPLLLMTFVENVFKYGVSKQESSDLLISLAISDAGIHFITKNRVFAQQQHRDDRTGIGISNSRKRLEHQYPDSHTLRITEAEDLFTVDLQIKS